MLISITQHYYYYYLFSCLKRLFFVSLISVHLRNEIRG